MHGRSVGLMCAMSDACVVLCCLRRFGRWSLVDVFCVIVIVIGLDFGVRCFFLFPPLFCFVFYFFCFVVVLGLCSCLCSCLLVLF